MTGGAWRLGQRSQRIDGGLKLVSNGVDSGAEPTCNKSLNWFKEKSAGTVDIIFSQKRAKNQWVSCKNFNLWPLAQEFVEFNMGLSEPEHGDT